MGSLDIHRYPDGGIIDGSPVCGTATSVEWPRSGSLLSGALERMVACAVHTPSQTGRSLVCTGHLRLRRVGACLLIGGLGRRPTSRPAWGSNTSPLIWQGTNNESLT